ncbi:FAD-binding domain-containing protein [Gallaecimonas mangrovi]|uniref:FAD-binding domain-containing protein n=1 Tax=Gallaecimonas mangrovi TaxID=2291597 RepID=UPI001866E1B5|nr:FAD-binding domain-containing protein [Gallaecimonas mangrovi]
MQGILLNGHLRLHRNPLFEGIEEAMLLWTWPKLLTPLKRSWLQTNLAKLQMALRARGADLFVIEPQHLGPFMDANHISRLRMAQPVDNEGDDLANHLDAEVISANRLFDRLPHHDTFSAFRQHIKAPNLTRSFAPAPISPVTAPTITMPPPMFRFDHGEDAAIERLFYFRERFLPNYHQSRQALLGNSFSSMLSVYLATGILAIDHVWQSIHSAPSGQGRDLLLNQLLWREFFQHWQDNQPKTLFESLPAPVDTRLSSWQQGKTGMPLVDAAMRELQETGYMSLKARQNCASFLVNDLQQDWRHGALWFEQHLLDGDIASNRGNWAQIAGYQQQSPLYFDVLEQSRHFDPDAAYIKYWLPELNQLNADEIFELPFAAEAQQDYPLAVGRDRWHQYRTQ